MPHRDPAARRRFLALCRRERNHRYRAKIIEALGGKCSCGVVDQRVLTIDHVEGGGGQERQTLGGNYYTVLWRRIRTGSSAYQVLCHNCNWIKRHERGENRKRLYP